MNIKEEINKCLHCKNPSCQKGCPARNDIPEFIRYAKEGNFESAFETILKTSNISPIACLVCDYERQCVGNCILNVKNNPVNIPLIEKYINDNYDFKIKLPNIDKKLKIATIGSGPASLSFALEMRKNGYDVTIFEKEKHYGGLLIYGIPEFRLSHKIVESYIDSIKKMGIHFINKEVNIDELKKEFDYIFLGAGLNITRKSNIPSFNNEYVIDALSFLHDYNSAFKYQDCSIPLIANKNVLVIGGGNVAIDAARCLKRLNNNVTIVYRRSEIEMPANKKEINEAKEEGINFSFLKKPVEAILKEDKLDSLKVEITKLGDKDESGRLTFISTGTYEEIKCDYIVEAIGQINNSSFDINNINDERILIGGDIIKATTVIEAASQGYKKAQELIIKYQSK